MEPKREFRDRDGNVAVRTRDFIEWTNSDGKPESGVVEEIKQGVAIVRLQTGSRKAVQI